MSDAHDPGVPFETWYVPYAQHAETFAAEHVYLMVRSHGDPLALVTGVQQAVARVDRTLAPYDAVAMDSYRDRTISRERVSAGFMLAFGAFGLLLAALGVYSVMAFSVAQRTAEFGVRLALGASTRTILPLVLRSSATIVGIGLLIGALAAVALNRILSAFLTEVRSIDIPILLGAIAVMILSAGAACLIPAIAAARLDPVRALRTQ